MIKKILLILLAISSGNCFAAGWTGDLTVGQIFTEGTTDLIVVYTTDGGSYTPSCSVNNWSFKADTEDRRNRAYSTLMAALASGKKVRFWFPDNCGPWSYHEATAVMLVK